MPEGPEGHGRWGARAQRLPSSELILNRDLISGSPARQGVRPCPSRPSPRPAPLSSRWWPRHRNPRLDGRSVLRGRKGVENDSLFSVEHGSSVQKSASGTPQNPGVRRPAPHRTPAPCAPRNPGAPRPASHGTLVSGVRCPVSGARGTPAPCALPRPDLLAVRRPVPGREGRRKSPNGVTESRLTLLTAERASDKSSLNLRRKFCWGRE